jgi:hypothetical protein
MLLEDKMIFTYIIKALKFQGFFLFFKQIKGQKY